MRLTTVVLAFSFLVFSSAFGQYPPPAGQAGSTAIHKDSSAFVNWAAACTVNRGHMNIAEPQLGLASAGSEENVAGIADNQILSLGDGGAALISFEKPIVNGSGADFAVFENSFLDDFLELAFIEVSSNGIDFFRFDAISLTSTNEQLGTYGLLDATKLHNLAGKYRVEYGTPFDLDDLPDDPSLDKNNITHVKIIDVVGCIQDEFATFDSEGNIINDPWPTAFESGGFDLDAVGIIHEKAQAISDDNLLPEISIYPNPAYGYMIIQSESHRSINISISDLSGKVVMEKDNVYLSAKKVRFPLDELQNGIYIGTISSEGQTSSFKVIRN